MLLNIEKDRLTLDGEPFYLACGDIQYFRIHPTEWKPRLEKMKDFGLTAVQTYCAWNLHEPEPGKFDFSGILDLAAFVRTCDEVGLKVMLRPSPFICGEWEFGAMPWWLLKDRHMRVRCSYPPYLAAVDRYYKRICEEFVPLLSTNGGPIIAVCLENEYGTVGTDLDYIRFLADTLVKYGVDVPLYQTDSSHYGVKFTQPIGTWQAINYRIESHTAVPRLQEIQPDLPAFVGEYWAGRSVTWGESGAGREVAPIAAAYRKALDLGAYVCFYMFAGGTNFGFMNGGRIGPGFTGGSGAIFRPITTSYQCDALLSEDGCATEKYYACRKELDEYLGKPVRTDRVADPEFQRIENVTLTEIAPLFDNIDAVKGKTVESPVLLTFEELDNPYGFVLYSSTLPECLGAEMAVTIQGLYDRALIFIDGELAGVQRRELPAPSIKVVTDRAHRIDILVENMGRENGRPHFATEKGILEDVRLGGASIFGWTHTTFPMTDLSKLTYGSENTAKPRFLRGTFMAKGGVSTHLHMKGWGKGIVVLNGFNLGRYWNIGPQETLYVPGALLRDGENELVIFELHEHDKTSVDFIEKAILDGEYIREEEAK